MLFEAQPRFDPGSILSLISVRSSIHCARPSNRRWQPPQGTIHPWTFGPRTFGSWQRLLVTMRAIGE